MPECDCTEATLEAGSDNVSNMSLASRLKLDEDEVELSGCVDCSLGYLMVLSDKSKWNERYPYVPRAEPVHLQPVLDVTLICLQSAAPYAHSSRIWTGVFLTENCQFTDLVFVQSRPYCVFFALANTRWRRQWTCEAYVQLLLPRLVCFARKPSRCPWARPESS